MLRARRAVASFLWAGGLCAFFSLLGCAAVTGTSDTKSSTGTKGTDTASDSTTSSDKGDGANAPVSLPPVVTDPSFILTAHLDTRSKGTASLTGTVARSDGTPVPGETVTAVLTRSEDKTQALSKALQIIPDDLEQVSGTTSVTDGRGTFTITFETVQEADKIFVASEKSNALKLDTLPPSLESAIDLNSNALSATGVTEIRADSFFLIRFSESMLTSSVNDTSVTITCDGAGTIPVMVTTSVDVVGVGFIEYRVAPTYSLPPLSNCVMTIASGSGGVLDLSDNPMAQSAAFALKTGPTTIKAFTQWLEVEDYIPDPAADPTTAVIGSTTYKGSIGTDGSNQAILSITYRSGDEWRAMEPQPESLGGTVKHIALAQGASMLYVAWSETDATGTEAIYLQHFDGESWIQDGSAISNTAFTATEPSVVFSGTTPYVTYQTGNTKVDQGHTVYETIVKRGQ